QPGVQLADLATQVTDGVYTIALSPPLDAITNAHLFVSVADNQGNVTRVQRLFSVGTGGPVPSVTISPQPTRTRLPTATPTATMVAVHDSVVLPPRRPINIRLRSGVESRSKTISIRVRNADARGDAHEIQLVADPGTCPSGVISGLPRFLGANPATQDRIIVQGGRRKTARVPLIVHRDAFTSPSATAPARCWLRFTAVGPGTDPTPQDNVVNVELQVVDGNDF
ncbi:MAG TPA: hypothetical protein VMT89_00845, partial [Candidatus Acidoferrales bacterium]|nr:hypothetical protein [Candidatus Acidoferrales bacterium]